MKEGIAFAHAHDVKVYVTANILAHNGDLDGVRTYFEELKEIGPDALIIADPGVLILRKRFVRKLNVISVRRQIIPTMVLIISGIDRGRAVWYRQENCRCRN